MTLWNKCVQAAFILDKHNPEWYKKIDLEKLDMNACGWCVFGQLFEEVDMTGQINRAQVLGIKPEAIGWHTDTPSTHGEWGDLNQKVTGYWKTLIKKRRQKYILENAH